MKKIMLVLLILFAFISVNAQLTNTKWKGVLHLDSPSDFLFDFRTDTLEAFSLPDSASVEIMQYSLKDTVLTIRKISGQSGCDDTVIAKYKVEIKDDEIVLILIEDQCYDRVNALNNTKWKKVP